MRNAFCSTLFFGALANAAFGKLLKMIVSAERPKESKRHASTHGMPSSHANSLSFFTAYLSLAAFEASFSLGLVILSATVVYTCCVCYCRIYRTRDHTVEQVFVGLCIGSISGCLVYLHVLPKVEDYAMSM